MFHLADWNRLFAISAAVLGLLTVGCVGTVFYQAVQSGRALGKSMQLASATGDNDLQSARRLLAEGANPNYEDCWTPLDMAVQNDNLEMVKLLLQHGADARHVSQTGPTLFIAQSDAVFNLLLEHGADANVHTVYIGGETILMDAIRKSNADRVRRLLAHSANPYLTDDKGQSAFDLIPKIGIYSSKSEKEIARLLSEASKRRRSP